MWPAGVIVCVKIVKLLLMLPFAYCLLSLLGLICNFNYTVFVSLVSQGTKVGS
jgi:hypothetical protein